MEKSHCLSKLEIVPNSTLFARYPIQSQDYFELQIPIHELVKDSLSSPLKLKINISFYHPLLTIDELTPL